ncbi:MAG: hypothetical protein IJN82_07640 [Clostridia bacterium]|nr:hypothetical protein [Clostridia bacterium]
MKNKIWIVALCIIALLLAGCASEPPVLQDIFDQAEPDRGIVTELVGAFATSGPTEDYRDTANVPYEQALKFFLHYGFYAGEDTVRPELEQYKAGEAYEIPAVVVDTYITSHFPTVVDNAKLECYDAENEVYTLTPVPADGSKYRMISMNNVYEDTYEIMMRDTDPADDKIGVKVNTFTVRLQFNELGYKFSSYQFGSVNYIRPDQSDADADGIHWYSPALPPSQTLEVINDGFKETEKGCQVTEDGGKTFTDVISREKALSLALEESEKDRYDDDAERSYIATEGGADDVELIRIESTFDPYWKDEWESDRYDFNADPLLWSVRLVDKNDPVVSVYIYLDVKSGEVMGAGTLRD